MFAVEGFVWPSGAVGFEPMAIGVPEPQAEPRFADQPRGDSHDLAVSLYPVLQRQCENRLGPVEWFRSAWQRGGAATGFSTWRTDAGTTIDVLVKLPVGPAEYRWTKSLGEIDLSQWNDDSTLCIPSPRVVAGGLELGDYDLAWIITERLAGRPTDAAHLTADDLMAMLRATAEFQARAAQVRPIEGRPPTPQWGKTIESSRTLCKAGGHAYGSRWNDALRKVLKHLDHLRARWESRPINSWCHGDLHPGNVMLRRPPSPGDSRPACPVLIDLALVHPGHWLEDALYLERQFWGHSELLHGVKPLTVLAKCRRELGLDANDQYAEHANTRRVLMAACAPALLEREGNAKYLDAALEVIERILPQVVR